MARKEGKTLPHSYLKNALNEIEYAMSLGVVSYFDVTGNESPMGFGMVLSRLGKLMEDSDKLSSKLLAKNSYISAKLEYADTALVLNMGVQYLEELKDLLPQTLNLLDDFGKLRDENTGMKKGVRVEEGFFELKVLYDRTETVTEKVGTNEVTVQKDAVGFLSQLKSASASISKYLSSLEKGKDVELKDNLKIMGKGRVAVGTVMPALELVTGELIELMGEIGALSPSQTKEKRNELALEAGKDVAKKDPSKIRNLVQDLSNISYTKKPAKLDGLPAKADNLPTELDNLFTGLEKHFAKGNDDAGKKAAADTLNQMKVKYQAQFDSGVPVKFSEIHAELKAKKML